MAEKTVAFLVARLNSSRMPAKHFRRIGKKMVIEWIVDQLKSCTEIDEIVLTTVAEEGNEPLRSFAEQHNISCFWYEGEVHHVTARLYNAALHHGAKICVLVSGDCPLIFGPAIDHLLHSFKKAAPAGVLRVDTLNRSDPPALYGVEIARLEAWEKAETLSDRPELKEHHFPVIGHYPELFTFHDCMLPGNLYAPFHRLFIDTWADYEFLNRVYDELTIAGKPFHLPEVLQLLETKQELRSINRHVHQRRLIEDIKKVLIIIDAGGEYGYGHLMRSLELALQIVERLSWPVVFLVDDEFAAKILETRGLRVLSGAFQRASRHNIDNTAPLETTINTLGYDLILIDIAKRPVKKRWRKELSINIPVVVIDKITEWTYGADLVIIPGVTAPRDKVDNWLCHKEKEEGRICSGVQYAIIRREVRYAKEVNSRKDIDLLVYLHDKEQLSELLNYYGKENLKIHVVDGKSDVFHELLARASFYLGQFGYSFYEALYLDCFPLATDRKKEGLADAANFYSSFAINQPNFSDYEDWRQVLSLQNQRPTRSKEALELQDGTPLLVEEIRRLVRAREED